MIKHASIVPLIGGETIAQQNILGSRPDYLLSYSPFKNNDSHLVNYYNNEVPYILLDTQGAPRLHGVDVVSTTCPCAGLSSLSPSASSNSAMNEWMFRSAEYTLGNVSPMVFWGENAPRLASKLGEPVVYRLRSIGKKYGYTFSMFKTKSLIHGLSQVRDRVFYFFWKGSQIPIFDYICVKDHEKIEDTIMNASKDAGPNDPMDILTNKKTPSADPFYQFLLDGRSHEEFTKTLTQSANVLRHIEASGTKYKAVAEWLRAKGFPEREAKKADRMHAKLESGGNIMRKQIEIPKNYIGAFVGHFPTMLTHPSEDRFLTVRECLAIMKLPSDFQLLNPSRFLNHICQNVPVTTAEFPVKMIKAYIGGELKLVETPFLIQDNKNRTITTDGEERSDLSEFFQCTTQE